MQKYEPQEFIDIVIDKLKQNGKQIPACPFCGGNNYTSTEDYSVVLIGKEMGNLEIGPCIPSGMLICKNCGHIDFFALGVLGMLPKEGGSEDGDK